LLRAPRKATLTAEADRPVFLASLSWREPALSAKRREFLQSSLAVGAAAGAVLAAPAIRGQEKAKRYRTALIGTGWWGMNILGEAVASNACEVVALCDVDESQLKAAAEKLSGKTSDQPKHYSDFRELLDKEKPEICIVATPDHWHPLITIAAVKSGATSMSRSRSAIRSATAGRWPARPATPERSCKSARTAAFRRTMFRASSS